MSDPSDIINPPSPIFVPANLQQFVVNVLQQDLTPLLQIATDISYIIGLCLIIGGLARLHRHGQAGIQQMQRVSPMATAMYFVSGIVLISFMPYLQMLSNSFFNGNSVLMQQCANPNPTGFTTGSNNFCPMMAYSAKVQAATGSSIVKTAIKYMAFGVLMFVGIISFIRGMVQLIRIGEGQQGGVGKALTHIFAGVVAVNADNVYYLAQSILQSAGRLSVSVSGL